MKIVLLLSILIFLTLWSCNNSRNSAAVKFHDVDVAEFRSLIDKGAGQLIDVRTPKEFAAGHIKGALNVDFYDASFKEELSAVLDLNKPVYVYCRSGGRSAKAGNLLKGDMEFEKPVYNLLGGYMAWSTSGQK